MSNDDASGINSLKALQKRLNYHLDDIKVFSEQNERDEYSLKFWSASENYMTAHQVYCASGAAIGNAVTKFSLVNGRSPKAEEERSVCDALEKPAEQLVVALRLALHCGTGKALTKILLSNTLRLFKSLVQLISAFQSGKDSKFTSQITGQVWECVEAIQKTPKSNRIACKRNLLECIMTIKDMLIELNELKEENENPLDNDVEFDSVLEISMESEELSRLSKFLQVLEKIHFLTRMGVASLARLETLEGGQISIEALGWVNSLSCTYEKLLRSVIEFGPACYPPQCQEEFHSHLPVVLSKSLELWQALKEFPGQDLFQNNCRNDVVSFDPNSITELVSELLTFAP